MLELSITKIKGKFPIYKTHYNMTCSSENSKLGPSKVKKRNFTKDLLVYLRQLKHFNPDGKQVNVTITGEFDELECILCDTLLDWYAKAHNVTFNYNTSASNYNTLDWIYG